MRNISQLTFLLFLLTSCLSLNQPILSDLTRSEKNEYFQTYHIVSSDRLSQDLINAIESSISIKMDALGYKSSSILPDLQIHYDIYQDKFTTQYLISPYSEEHSQPRKEILKKVKLKHGSIYISLFNKDGQYVVWRGFTDGHSLNPRIVKSKAYEIMDHYQVYAASGEQMITAR